MGKILLDYVFPISVVATIPEASTGYLKQVCVIAKPKTGQEGNIGVLYECTTMAQVLARTDNTNAQQLFNAGMSKVYLILQAELDLSTELELIRGIAWTVLISDDYSDADITVTAATGTATITSYANLVSGTADSITVGATTFTAQSGAATLGTATFQAATSNDLTAASLAAQINAHAVASTKVTATVLANAVTLTAKVAGEVGNAIVFTYANGDANVGATVTGSGTLTNGDGLELGVFDGVVGYSSTDEAFAKTFGSVDQHSGWLNGNGSGAKNMFYGFGKLLSNLATWANQQYIPMPVSDAVTTLGSANTAFDDRVSFVITDADFGSRLGLFAAGGKAIAAPYIGKNLRLDLQSRTLTWIAANQPTYSNVNAALLEGVLQDEIIQQRYIDTKLIDDGVIEVKLLQSNFVASGFIDIAEPTALWRMFGQMKSTL